MFSALAINPDEIVVTIGSNRITGWASVSITRWVEQFLNAFTPFTAWA